MLVVFFALDKKRSKLDENGLMAVFNKELKDSGVLTDYTSAKDAYAKRAAS